MFKLICDTDPITAGIEKPDGSWDFEQFKKHISTCSVCSQFVASLIENLKETFKNQDDDSAWQYRYILPSGEWEKWFISKTFEEALKNCQIYAQNRPFEIIRHNTAETIKEAISILDQSIELQEKTRHAFKSKTIAQSRELTEKAKKILEQII